MTIFAIAYIRKFEDKGIFWFFRTCIKKRPEKLISGLYNIKRI